ncbi:hypothetical protein Tco_1464504, partial [Tanacetum coccineum]
WPEWGPCRARIRDNRDCGRGFPSADAGRSADGLRERPKPIRVRLAISGPCQCGPGLSLGLYPTGITSTYFKSHPLVDIVRYTWHHLAALRIHYAKVSMFSTASSFFRLPEMDLFAFIHHSDPTKVRIGERDIAEKEVKLLKMTEGHTVSLDPPVTVASGGSGDSIDKLFDEGDDVGQEHSVERGDDVLEETIARDVLDVVVEKAKKKPKRRVTGDASGSTHPPKKLREDYQSILPNTSGKSLAAPRGLVPEGSGIPSGVTEPLITASVPPTSDVGP